MIRTTVLVIGGGATGAGIARDLALRGVDVTLVDRDGLDSGTTDRSHGLLHSGARYAETDRPSAEESIAENRILKEIAGDAVKETGGLFVQLGDDDPAYFDRKREACEEIGIPTEVIDGEEAKSRAPGLPGDVERAFTVPDAITYPARLVAMNAADAREHGASIYPHAPVEDMTVENGRITSVAVGGMVNDKISPEYVVNAAGPWAGKIGEMAGVDINMFLSRGAMTAVEYDELNMVLNRAREPSNADIVVPHESEVILGTTSVPIDDPDNYDRDPAEIDELRTKSAELLPPVEDAPERRTWWGVRPLYAPDDGAGDGRDVSRDFFRLDHADDGVENIVSAVGGKLTTYRQMAESTSDLVAERLGVDANSTTAEQQLIGADDAELADAFVDEFSAAGIADANTVATADSLTPADD